MWHNPQMELILVGRQLYKEPFRP